jgi:predicted DNA-binding transcriptional regulator AlpA
MYGLVLRNEKRVVGEYATRGEAVQALRALVKAAPGLRDEAVVADMTGDVEPERRVRPPRQRPEIEEGMVRPRSPFIRPEDVAERYGKSLEWVWEQCRQNRIPHRRWPSSRGYLFLEVELEAWESGAPLNVQELPDGGKVVKPKG